MRKYCKLILAHENRNRITSMTTLDEFDCKILQALQKDGRLTSHKLAEITNLSASQCARRRRRLEELGIIKSYRANLSKRKTGFGISAFIQVSLNNQDTRDIKSFSRFVWRIVSIHVAQVRANALCTILLAAFASSPSCRRRSLLHS